MANQTRSEIMTLALGLLALLGTACATGTDRGRESSSSPSPAATAGSTLSEIDRQFMMDAAQVGKLEV